MSKAKKGEDIKCIACGKVFYVPRYRVENAKFCSRECQNHTQYKSQVKCCQNCKVEFTVSESRQDRKFCSPECYQFTTTTEKDRRRHSKSLNILKRGRNSTRTLKKHISRVRKLFCDNCGYDKAGYNLEIHHIDKNPENNELENLAVLCCMCHRDLHYGKLRFKDNIYYEED